MLKPKKSRLKLKLAVLGVLIIVGVWFGLSNDKNSAPPPVVVTEPVDESVDHSLADLGFEVKTKATPLAKSGSESGVTSPPVPSTAPYLLSPTTKSVILDCAKESDVFRRVSSADHFETLDEYLTQSISQNEKPMIVLQYRNIHATNRENAKRRLHVAAAGGDEGAAKMEAQVFAVDQDDLPVPIDLPREYENLAWPDMIRKFIEETHNKTLDESQNSYRWNSGASAQITERNGQIEELQVYLENHDFLGCSVREGRQIDCQCKLGH